MAESPRMKEDEESNQIPELMESLLSRRPKHSCIPRPLHSADISNTDESVPYIFYAEVVLAFGVYGITRAKCITSNYI